MPQDLGIGTAPKEKTETVQIDFTGMTLEGAAKQGVSVAKVTQAQETPAGVKMVVEVAPETAVAPNQAPQPEPIVIDLAYVNALVEKLQSGSKKLKTYKEFYESYKASYDKSCATVQAIAEQYMRELYTKEGHKTFAIPCGATLRLKKKADAIEFTDYDAAVKWAEETKPDILKKELLISEVRKWTKATGEEIPGTEEKKYKELNFSLSEEKNE